MNRDSFSRPSCLNPAAQYQWRSRLPVQLVQSIFAVLRHSSAPLLSAKSALPHPPSLSSVKSQAAHGLWNSPSSASFHRIQPMQVWLALCFCLLLVISSRSLAQEDPDDWDLSVKLVEPRVPASENRRLYVSSVIDMGIRACVCGSLNINTTGHRFSYSVDATCPGHVSPLPPPLLLLAPHLCGHTSCDLPFFQGSQRSDEHGAVDDQGCAETWADQCRNACPREVFHCFTAAVDSFHMHHCEGRKMNVSVDIEISPADCEPNGNHSCPSRHFGTSVLVQVTGDELTQTYLVLSLISALACLLVIGLHIRYTELRRFPNDIVFWRTVCDLGFAAQVRQALRAPMLHPPTDGRILSPGCSVLLSLLCSSSG